MSKGGHRTGSVRPTPPPRRVWNCPCMPRGASHSALRHLVDPLQIAQNLSQFSDPRLFTSKAPQVNTPLNLQRPVPGSMLGVKAKKSVGTVDVEPHQILPTECSAHGFISSQQITISRWRRQIRHRPAMICPFNDGQVNDLLVGARANTRRFARAGAM